MATNPRDDAGQRVEGDLVGGRRHPPARPAGAQPDEGLADVLRLGAEHGASNRDRDQEQQPDLHRRHPLLPRRARHGRAMSVINKMLRDLDARRGEARLPDLPQGAIPAAMEGTAKAEQFRVIG